MFAAAQGETSLLEQTADGHYFMFRIDGVEPAHDRPLADVRGEVETAWRTAEQTKKAARRAPRSCGRRQAAPRPWRSWSQDHADTRLVEIGPVIRSDDGAAQGVSAEAIGAMFATRAGEVAAGVVAVPGGTAIVGVDEVIPATVDEQMLTATEARARRFAARRDAGRLRGRPAPALRGVGEPVGGGAAHGAAGAMIGRRSR